MSATKRIEETLGEARSPSQSMFESRPAGFEEVGTPEAKIRALEHDVAKLRDALLLGSRDRVD
jgi:hypothetical protein